MNIEYASDDKVLYERKQVKIEVNKNLIWMDYTLYSNGDVDDVCPSDKGSEKLFNSFSDDEQQEIVDFIISTALF
jgi:hypothetical protein